MELKVWVDGIKRVVCGVTDHTTCQDIVIALAQAMGRTGRFTLIEQWRDNERPLAPDECPLLVLQKWGEFANEVKLILYESGTRKKQKLVENEKLVKKTQDRFTHNFTPPVKTNEAVVRRSLTFSGTRKPDTGTLKKGEQLNPGYGMNILPNKNLAPPQHKVQNEGHSWSNSSSIPPQSSSAIPQQHRQPRSSSQDRLLSNDHRRQSPQPQHIPHPTHRTSPQPSANHRSSPQHPTNHRTSPQHLTNHRSSPQHLTNQGSLPQHLNNHRSSSQHPTNHRSSPQHPTNQNHAPQFLSTNQNHNVPKSTIPPPNHIQNPTRPPYTRGDKHSHSVPVMNGPIRPSAFSPVHPRRNSTEDEHDMMRIPNTDIPVYTQQHKSSHQQAVEEYDLDSNFPDVVKETGHEYLVEEYHVPGGKSEGHSGHHGNRLSFEEQERVKLLRLVTMQNERIKMQDSQLDIIDTEISSREQKLEDLKLELNTVLEQLTELTETDKAQTEEIVTLDNSNLIDEMEKEKQIEKEMKNELNSLQARLEKCETDLHQFKTKVKLCSEDLEKETELQKIDEKRRKEEEVKLQSEIQDLKKNIEERSKELQEKTKTAEEVQTELQQLSDELEGKTNDLTTVEKELQKENMRFFKDPKTSTEKSSKLQESNGEAVIKVLEGGVSPNLSRKMAATPLAILTTTKGKNGVWV